MVRLHLLLLFVPLLQAQQTVTIQASSDGAAQPALVWVPTGIQGTLPLVVHLHSWSSHFDSSEAWQIALKEAQKRNWAFVSPEFRGPNERPEACASPIARQDILDSVDYMKQKYPIDSKRVYLLGGSGGGHMTLVMAAHYPDRWRAASAWVPISDLAAWYEESRRRNLRYWRMMEGCTGGTPASAANEYKLRSPLPYLHQANGLPIDIQAGIQDGHTGSVPVSHSLRAFNVLAAANGHATASFANTEISHIVSTKQVPKGSPAPPTEERRTRILLRRIAGPARITLFDGGHETDFPAAFIWFDSLDK
ncbi:MAG TPA: prolyl oligopeptidase family serine peptidase [Bryobacteraceae bacterium]|nr:prolyl oligopeptidase family serine peptidase [Bryobacteraceae bacterium]